MKTIYLFCNQGMSTSMLVKKMQAAVAEMHYDAAIAAWPLSEVDVKGAEADMILLGPQVRYAVKKIAAQFPDKKVDAVDMRSYGLMDGKAVVEMAKKVLGE